ncbi:MAG TPA: prepilin peptidase [Gammaproteobacteria bacterium]|nr:prepilin peptidase [Gammaproteobacteria bacterium]
MHGFAEMVGQAGWTGGGVLLALLVLAVAFDVRQRRIPNRLVIAGLVAGVALQGLFGGPWGLLGALGGALLLLLLTFPFFALGWLGAGDVKLLAAVGSFVTWHYAPAVLLTVGLAGGLVGSAAMAWQAGLGQWWHRVGALVGVSIASRGAPRLSGSSLSGSSLSGSSAAGVEVPYAIAIALGTVGSAFLVRLVPALVL